MKCGSIPKALKKPQTTYVNRHFKEFSVTSLQSHELDIRVLNFIKFFFDKCCFAIRHYYNVDLWLPCFEVSVTAIVIRIYISRLNSSAFKVMLL